MEIMELKMGAKKGHILTEETKKKIGLANAISLKGNHYPNKSKFKKGCIPWNKNKKIGKQSKKTIEKKSKSIELWWKNLRGTEKEKIRNYKISLSQLGENNNACGSIAKIKNGQAHSREKCYFWKGGISFEPYSVDWTKTLKRAIKERDKFKCQLCNKDEYLVVHHIDYNKKNCSSENLITLCSSCHSKTNINREKWKQIFKQII